MARLRSQIWVSAFLRSEASGDAFAVVARKGAPEAGAIFVVHDHLDGTLSVYGPAPQSFFQDQEEEAGRMFERVLERVPAVEAREWLDRQVRFDSDCWIVETERRHGNPTLV